MHRNQKFLVKLRQLGYCCPWEFFRQMSGRPTEEIATFLGVRTRTIRFWKARAQHCEGNRICHDQN